jgi:hypothetical protein
MALRETALFVNNVSSLADRERLRPPVVQAVSAFDAQMVEGPLDTGRVRKAVIELYAHGPVPNMNPSGRVLERDIDIVAHAAPFDVVACLALQPREQVETLFDAHVAGLLALAKRFDWDVEQFESAAHRARMGGLVARLRREKTNPGRTLKAVLEGRVEGAGTHLTLTVVDIRSGTSIAVEDRKIFADYWGMRDVAHDLKWSGDAVQLVCRPRSIAVPLSWRVVIR